jgi:hypothetical protein
MTKYMDCYVYPDYQETTPWGAVVDLRDDSIYPDHWRDMCSSELFHLCKLKLINSFMHIKYYGPIVKKYDYGKQVHRVEMLIEEMYSNYEFIDDEHQLYWMSLLFRVDDEVENLVDLTN